MSRSERFIGTTYYEILEAYFEKMYEEPLTNAERAFMASLLHLCNRARGDEISMSIRMLANATLMRPSTVAHCLDTLQSKGYLKYQSSSTKCLISVQELYKNRPIFSQKAGSTSDFWGVREEKGRQDKKESDNNFYKNSFEVDSPVSGQRKLPNNNTDETFQKEKTPQWFPGMTMADL